jgi:dUTP pyrophosphatase
MHVQLKRLNDKAIIPLYGTSSAAGLDLVACIDSPITISPGQKSILIPTGIAIYISDPNVAALILPRSGLGHKSGLVLGNGSGVIDADYQGELFVSVCVRPGHNNFVIESGMRIAQLVLTPIIRAEFDFVDEFRNDSTRGDGGFGSTGVSSN